MNKKNSLSIFFVFACCLTFLLGTWQYQRLIWKNDLINNVEQSINNPSIFDESIIYPELTGVISSNNFSIQNNPIFVGSKTYQGKNGFHLYFPVFKNTDLITVLNAGWISSTDKENINDIYNQILNTKTYKIYLRNYFIKKPYFTPENNVSKNEWFYPGRPDLENFYQKKIQLDQYFVLAEVSINKYFVNPMNLLRNSHLQYLLTWYLLSFTSLVMLVINRRYKNE